MFNKKIKARLKELENELGIVSVEDDYTWSERVEGGFLAETNKRLRKLETLIKAKK